MHRSWFLSTNYNTPMNRRDFERQCDARYGTLGAAGPCVSLIANPTPIDGKMEKHRRSKNKNASV